MIEKFYESDLQHMTFTLLDSQVPELYGSDLVEIQESEVDEIQAEYTRYHEEAREQVLVLNKKTYDEFIANGFSDDVAIKLSGYSETSILDDIDVKHKDKKRKV